MAHANLLEMSQGTVGRNPIYFSVPKSGAHEFVGPNAFIYAKDLDCHNPFEESPWQPHSSSACTPGVRDTQARAANH